MEKLNYQKPISEIVEMSNEDVIRTSGDPWHDNGNGNKDPNHNNGFHGNGNKN